MYYIILYCTNYISFGGIYMKKIASIVLSVFLSCLIVFTIAENKNYTDNVCNKMFYEDSKNPIDTYDHDGKDDDF